MSRRVVGYGIERIPVELAREQRRPAKNTGSEHGRSK